MQENSSTKRIVRIRLRGLANTGSDNLAALRSLSGFNLSREGQDYVVYDDDPKLREASPPFIVLGERIDIRCTEAAAKITAAVACAPSAPDVSMPTEIGVIDDLGFLSRLDAAARPFFFAPIPSLELVVAEQVLPVMVELNAWTARSITTDIKAFYARVALPKMSFLIERFGSKASVGAIFDRRLLSGVLPSPLEPLELLDALLIFPPHVAALSLHRPSCAVAFIADRVKIFDNRVFQGLPNYLVPELTHLLTRGAGAALKKCRFDGEADQFLSVVTQATNSFWAFFTTPLLWLGDDGIVDDLRQIKGMSLARLLVSDVLAIQRASSAFARTRLMFEFFDKFAALCVERHAGFNDRQRQTTEANWAPQLMQNELLSLVIRIFNYQYRTTRQKVFLLLAEFSEAVRKGIVRDFAKMHAEAGEPITQESVSECIRIIRNLVHGTFLSSGRFEKLFLKINPSLPVDAHRLPWVYLLAFGIDPKFFVDEAISILTKKKLN